MPRWEKRGVIFTAGGEHGWINSHAQVPTALLLDDRLRIYFATRPRPGLSLPAFIDLDRNDPSRIIALHDRPILELGRPGTFDCDGVMPSAAVRDNQRVLLYYSGWCGLSGRVPFNNATGLAVSIDDGATFERMFEGPILDRTPHEPWSASSPAVVRADGRWYLWYSSGTGWIDVDGKLEHVYVLKRATSSDGIHWLRDHQPIFPSSPADESQTKPTIIERSDGGWHMWFCYRGSRGFRENGQTYRIGYAWSTDLETWHRDDAAAGIDVSTNGWDAQMIAYPEAIAVDNETFLFYNGNGFGMSGFGYAVLVKR